MNDDDLTKAILAGDMRGLSSVPQERMAALTAQVVQHTNQLGIKQQLIDRREGLENIGPDEATRGTLTADEIVAIVQTVIKNRALKMATKQPALDQPLQQNSITKLQALVPVRVATSKILEGTWVGPALDEARVVGSLFGGAHYILQLGYNQVVGQAASFRLVFVAHMPVEKGTVLTDPVVIDEARRTAEAFMHMLNMRRVAGANATQTRQNAAGATLVSSFQGSGSAIPGKPLTGKRADVLIIDEVSDLKKPVV